jgi:hypothetical protein
MTRSIIINALPTTNDLTYWTYQPIHILRPVAHNVPYLHLQLKAAKLLLPVATMAVGLPMKRVLPEETNSFS